MKKLNIPLALFLVFGTLASVVGIHFLHGYQVARSAESLRERAAQAAEVNDREEQVRLLRRYLRHRPEDLETMVTLYQVVREKAIEDEDWRTMGGNITFLNNAVRETPEHEGLRREAFIWSRTIGRASDAIDHVTLLDAMGSVTDEDRVIWASLLWANSTPERSGWDEGNPEGDELGPLEMLCEMIGFDWQQLAFVDKSAEQDEDESEQDKRLVYAPDQIDAYSLLATIYLRDHADPNDLTVSNRIIDKGIERNPDSAPAYMKRASFVQQNVKGMEGVQQSVPDVRKALELAPDDMKTMGFATQTAFRLKDFDWAEEILATGRAANEDNWRYYHLLAASAQLQGDMDKAVAQINAGLERFPLHTELLAKRAEYEIDMNQLERAEETISRLSERVNSIYIQYLRARVFIARKKYLEASRLLEQLRPLVAEDSSFRRRFDAGLAQCYRALKMHDKLAQLGGTGNNAQSTFNRATALATQGKHREAILLLEELGQDDDLTDEGRQAIRRQLYNTLILQQKSLPTQQRDWSRVDRYAQSFLEQNMPDAVKERFAIDLLVHKELASDALRRTERAVRKFPRDAQFRFLLARLTPDYQQALNILSRLREALGDSADIRLAQIKRTLEITDADRRATQLQELGNGLDDFSPSDRAAIRNALVDAYRRLGETDTAFEIARAQIAEGEQAIEFVLVMFDMAVASGNEAVMRESQRDLASIATTDSAEWKMCEAQRLLWLHAHGEAESVSLDEIQRLISAALERRPGFAPINVLQAELQLLRGDDEAAIESFRIALENRPGQISYMKRLFEVLRDNDRLAEAREIQRQLPVQVSADREILVEIQRLLSEDPKLAIARAEEAFSPDSDDFLTLMQLTNIYLAAGEKERAAKILQRAVKIEPAQQQAWLAYVQTLGDLKRTDEAKAVVAEAAKHLTSNPFAMGQLYASAGDYDRAFSLYDEALAKEPKNGLVMVNIARLHQALGNTDELTKTLDRIVAIEDSNDPSTVMAISEARRLRAQQLAGSATFADFQRGVELIEQNRNERGRLGGPDLLLWLQLHASRPDAPSRRKAVNQLVELRGQRSLSTEESVILARLRQQDGNWPEAQTLMLNVIAKNPNQPNFIATYISWLLERGETDDAAKYLRRLNPKSVVALQFACMIRAQRGQSKQAYELLMKRVPAQINRLQAAMILEEMGKYDPRFFKAAKKQWELHLADDPAQVPNYVQFLGRIPKAGGLTDALNLAETQLKAAIKDENPQLAQYYINLGLTALRAARNEIPADSPQYDRVLSWMELAKQAKVDEVTIAWDEFDFYDIRRDYPRLRTMYAEFLERTDTTELQRAVIRNNLAYLHALANEGGKALEVIGDAISQLGPRADLLDTRGLAYMVDGQIDNALRDLREATKGAPYDAGLYFHLALAEQKAGNPEASVAALQKSLELGLEPDDLSEPEQRLLEALQRELKPLMDSEVESVDPY